MSEFGRGLTYCLGLFLCHTERDWGNEGTEKILKGREDLWFNAASDHLYELEIPDFLPKLIKKRLLILKNKSVEWGHGFREKKATKEDKMWAIDEAKELLRLIDEYFKIETEKGEWE